ncbi:MAG: hypothetical protein U0930_00690 [Pirellulales bacterium]
MLSVDEKKNSIETNMPRLRLTGLMLLFGLIFPGLQHDVQAQGVSTSQSTSKQQDSPNPNGGSNSNVQQDDQAKLTDGLLDLLNEPSSADKSSGSKQNNPSQPNNSALKKEPVTQSDQANSRSSNPLVDVQSKMLQAATMMQQPKLILTVKVQTEIVQQLDDLISQLEQQDKSQQKNSQRTSQQRQQRQESQSQLENQSAANNKQKQRTAGDQPGNESSEQARARDMSVRTKDPSALQQNVWGHLPSRVRAQMESRMVEEFLPSYRAKIEEYYRSLMEESERK